MASTHIPIAEAGPSLYPIPLTPGLQSNDPISPLSIHPVNTNINSLSSTSLPSASRHSSSNSTTTLFQPHHSSRTRRQSDASSHSSSVRTKSFRTKTIRVWGYELFCASLALASLIAIFAVIWAYDGEALPELPYGLSMNTIVAVFTAIIKASIGLVLSDGLSHLKWTALQTPQLLSTFEIYDQASRGPWGAAHLLLRYGWKASMWLPSVGSLMVILLLPVDPLAQQILVFRHCSRNSAESATIGRAQIIDHSIDGIFANVTDFYDVSEKYTQPLASALGRAILTTETPQEFRYWDCASGNCTFSGEYTSLGFSSSCVDVSDQLLTQFSNTSRINEMGELVQNSTYTHTLLDNWDNLTISDEVVFIDFDGGNSCSGMTNPGVFVMGVGSPFFDVEFELENRPHSDPTMNVSIIKILGRDTDRESFYDENGCGTHRTYGAITCSFRPHLRTYRGAEIKQDGIYEDMASSQPLAWGRWLGQGSYYSVADLRCLSDPGPRYEILRAIGYSFDESARWLPYNISYQYDPASKWTKLGEYITRSRYLEYIDPKELDWYEKGGVDEEGEEQYKLNQTAREVIPKECIYQFGEPVNDLIKDGFTKFFEAELVWETVSRLGSGKGTLEDMQQTMDRVADFLTHFVRSHADRTNNQPVRGWIQTNTICLEVRWAWAAYLISTLTIFLVFFAAMMVSSRLSRIRNSSSALSGDGGEQVFHDFKTSSLPMFFSEMDRSELEGNDPLAVPAWRNSTSELEKAAKRVRIRLETTEDGSRIVFVPVEGKKEH